MGFSFIKKINLIAVEYKLMFFLLFSSLAFSVTIFCSMAVVAILILLMRRHPAVGGELGGPEKYKMLTSIVFTVLWVIYMVLSTLEVYGVIKGF